MAPRLEQLARELADAQDVDTTLEGALRVAVQLAPCDLASVSVRRQREIETTAATDGTAEEAHNRQRELGEGPCLDVEWGDDGLLIVPDLADEDRWPRWSVAARELGLRSLLAVKLFTREQTVGALDLYSTTLRRYDEDDILSARMIAERVSASLGHAREQETLWEAVHTRHEIGQAQGILMERFQVSADTAFAVMRRYSQEKNQKLRDVAADVVRERSLPGE
jgi:GAF domain-containing protein